MISKAMDDRVTAALADARAVWKIGRDQYQAAQGVKRPYICEISPFQYAGLSRRAKVEHDFRRAREWQASADCAAQYARLCHAAYREDLSILTHPELHADARDAIHLQVRAAETALAEQRMRDARAANQIRSATDVCPGDRVFDILRGRYAVVVKSLKVSIRVELTMESGFRDIYSAPARRFQWLCHNDLKDAVARRLPIVTGGPDRIRNPLPETP